MKKPTYITDYEAWCKEFNYFFPVQVRFSETDAFGHLNNTQAFVYFEHARIQFLKVVGLMTLWMKTDDLIPVTADLQCDYFKQVFFDEALRIGVKVMSIGTSSVELHYIILNEQNQVCMTGRGRIVQISKRTGASKGWNDETLSLLKKGQIKTG
ncbi:acyl-CoA thioesterase [Salipaludibacillus agaradhaerens]|uniref:Acyl-CoA thioesterase n=1 Tax=Salipaludibacillus agaradhaerens TaxID=76935 RepID=A0A9Q4AZG2_SALAG|nr:acyl-CoA thioesterase [Salipaludibacillus agaradhaerens]MCR6095601.1 acyl-CoA thioesterase [Salipaludibacillus agaradhaerens]MCR6114839.1 acyl-CoA thioesterase [Salipaludibacillus agaradhaerens]